MEYYSALAKRRQDEKQQQQQQKELSAAAESLSLTPRRKSSRLSVDADAKLDAQSSTNQTNGRTKQHIISNALVAEEKKDEGGELSSLLSKRRKSPRLLQDDKAKLSTTESIDDFGGNEDGSCDDAEVEGEYTFQFDAYLAMQLISFFQLSNSNRRHRYWNIPSWNSYG